MSLDFRNITFDTIPLGFRVRRQLKKTSIFRVRYGNGSHGSILGRCYQDKYPYFVPSSIRNVESAPARTAYREAVLNWQTVLTQSQKDEYNRRGQFSNRISGYCFYIREYILNAL